MKNNPPDRNRMIFICNQNAFLSGKDYLNEISPVHTVLAKRDKLPHIPADTRRCFSVCKTSIRRPRRRTDVL